jgi:magnesium chelatase family protein
MLMIGPPGSGKTMLAERLSQLLPSVTPAAAREIAEIYSACGLQLLPPGKAPFRAPHHGASAPALTGGGSLPQPGEVSLAHNGVLFLDELPEFRRDALEALREPLEAGSIRISRQAGSAEFPARFQLIAAMNPCPIGLVCTPTNCRCSPEQAERYRNRISAPILDRIDLHISVHTVPIASLLNARAVPKDSNICERINTARRHQLTRSEHLNAHLDLQQTKEYCDCDVQTLAFLGEAAQRLQLSARVFYRTLRVARTIADLADQPAITREGVEEALSYRPIAPQ